MSKSPSILNALLYIREHVQELYPDVVINYDIAHHGSISVDMYDGDRHSSTKFPIEHLVTLQVLCVTFLCDGLKHQREKAGA